MSCHGWCLRGVSSELVMVEVAGGMVVIKDSMEHA